MMCVCVMHCVQRSEWHKCGAPSSRQLH